jgi:hypothetical protein
LISVSNPETTGVVIMAIQNSLAVRLTSKGGRLLPSWGCVALGFLLLAAEAPTAFGQVSSLSALTTFGSNGWLAPSAVTFLGTANNARGLAFNPVTGNLVLATREGGNAVRILNATTGGTISGLSVTGISGGGGAALNMVGVAGDGAIYVGNLSTSATDPFKVYRYADETTGVAPSVAFSGTVSKLVSGTILNSNRLGDSLAVIGSGNSTLIAASGNTNNTSTPTGATTNSNYSVFSYASGSATPTPFFAVPGTTTTNGNNDFRLSLTFVDSDTLIGQRSGGTPRLSDFSIGSGTAGASSINGLGGWTILGYKEIDAKPYLAAINVGNSNVGVFDLSVAGTATLLNSLNVTSVFNANGNGTGAIAWGNTTLSSGSFVTPLYAMNTNNGIQAMVFAVPEPSTTVVVAGCTAGLATLVLRKRKRSE